jgi:protein-S-isoprenylcysteine O-methyltransferase Ste14
VADLAVFLDYGHWHLVPGLERRSAQAFGLVMYLGVVLWQKWADRYLHAAFASQALLPKLMRTGPFAYVRHPRYAGALAGKVAAAMLFASALGWLQAVLWSALLLRQVGLEEAHLRDLFGREYEDYSAHTARLIPGIY